MLKRARDLSLITRAFSLNTLGSLLRKLAGGKFCLRSVAANCKSLSMQIIIITIIIITTIIMIMLAVVL